MDGTADGTADGSADVVKRETAAREPRRGGGGGGAVYGLGLVGALVYFVRAADGFWSGVLGVLKALVWPAFLTHDLLKFLGT
jgi:hypothetical protein